MPNRKKKTLWSIIAIFLVSLSAFFAQTHRRAEATTAKTNAAEFSKTLERVGPVKAQKPVTGQIVGPVQMVRFTVFDEGIRPAEAHVSAGWIAVYIDDQTARNSARLLVQTEHGVPKGEVVRQVGRLRGSTQMNLQPGRYRIREAGQPGSSATLIVQP